MLVFPFYLPCMNRSHIQMMCMGKCAKYLNKLSQLFSGKVNECAHLSKRYKSYTSYWYTSYCCLCSLCRTIGSCWLVSWLYITPAFIWPKYCRYSVNTIQSINHSIKTPSTALYGWTLPIRRKTLYNQSIIQ